jgi:hypothetical protein
MTEMLAGLLLHRLNRSAINIRGDNGKNKGGNYSRHLVMLDELNEPSIVCLFILFNEVLSSSDYTALKKG